MPITIESVAAGIAPQSTNRNALVFTASAVKSITVPTSMTMAAFSATVDFAVNVGGTAAWPTADVTNGTASDINPTMRSVEAGQVISVAAYGPGVVGVVFY